jgi:hypothetical protein
MRAVWKVAMKVFLKVANWVGAKGAGLAEN